MRLHDKSPSFLLATEQDPRSRFYIVRLDSNDKDATRSLKIGKSGAFTSKLGNTPDPDWAFAFDSVEQKHGTWTMTLRKPLERGEYGIFAARSQELFDFGID